MESCLKTNSVALEGVVTVTWRGLQPKTLCWQCLKHFLLQGWNEKHVREHPSRLPSAIRNRCLDWKQVGKKMVRLACGSSVSSSNQKIL